MIESEIDASDNSKQPLPATMRVCDVAGKLQDVLKFANVDSDSAPSDERNTENSINLFFFDSQEQLNEK
jgi:hypothetical protein